MQGNGWISPTITTSPNIYRIEETNVKNNSTIWGRVLPTTNKIHQRQEVYNTMYFSPTLTATDYKDPPKVLKQKGVNKEMTSNNTDIYRIRKLTPLECFRLMGFSDVDFLSAKLNSHGKAEQYIRDFNNEDEHEHFMMMQKAESKDNMVVSNTQLYKMAGNSIVVDVLYHIYKSLYNVMPYLFDDLKVGSFFSGIGAFESGLDRVYEDINAETN